MSMAGTIDDKLNYLNEYESKYNLTEDAQKKS